MTPCTTPLDEVLASGISDRAFRLYCALILAATDAWVPLADLAERTGLTSHEARGPLGELASAGLAEKDRRWVPGLKSNRAYARLPQPVPTAAAEVAA
ncbi:hypothetical protein [Streptomyces longispororuber]|uniref:hypothetical protein n=1 Tax=Streptomyces longispororuber TaxID=68230 RepID=UPI0036FBC082